ncbi:hypothetical protein AXG53_09625 [Stenotrophomonas sp. KCTC 12332]|nr:hypothetical protein AXG53_09625 [Stenotrophomonas sp. KCTC 12332]
MITLVINLTSADVLMDRKDHCLSCISRCDRTERESSKHKVWDVLACVFPAPISAFGGENIQEIAPVAQLCIWISAKHQKTMQVIDVAGSFIAMITNPFAGMIKHRKVVEEDASDVINGRGTIRPTQAH